MKFINVFTVLIFLSLLITGCTGKEERAKQKSKDLLTSRTLGLAYLEENKLEDAEKEFKKFIDLAPKEKLGYANLGLVYLRMGKYPEAEKTLKKAIKIDPKDADIRLILAQVYEMSDKKESAISELEESLNFAPDHIKTLYSLSELYATMNDTASQKQRMNYLSRVVKNDPANIVSRLDLTEIYIRREDAADARTQMEEIVRLFPEFPKEAVEYYDQTVSDLQVGNCKDALTPFIIFNNYLKVTPPYQAGINDLKGPGGSLIGFPIITFDKQINSEITEEGSILDAIHFTDITAAAGLDVPSSAGQSNTFTGYTNVAASDYDGDGDIDFYVGNYDSVASVYKHYLFKNEMGKFFDIADEAGLKHSGIEYSSIFDDYDNDGFFDLFIIKEGGNLLYRNTGKGTFDNVTDKAKVGQETDGNKALFFDIDHDGDLDLFIAKPGLNFLYRNNGNGTFHERAEEMHIAGGNVYSSDAAFWDFDEDGDIDLFVANKDTGNVLYSNQRQEIFKDVINESGLEGTGKSGTVAVGDYNNDGFQDIFVSSSGKGHYELFLNSGDGKFQKDSKSDEIFSEMKSVRGYDASFFDFDNDGHLDLLVVGESSEKDGKGVFLFHNNGRDNFEDVSHLLPEDLKSGRQITTFDYNADGDVDLVISGINGGIRLLRNDGGNLNHFVKIKLKGLRTGSAKNNYYGIGAKVEMRSGDLYQTIVVTNPDIIFGLGNRLKSDVIRITWTNGVPQNIFFPGTDQSIIEAQVLKGSCPFLYTWNGEKYVFVKDIIWRSALGMPLGIMGGTTTYGFPDASDDYVKIPGSQLKPRNGVYSIQVTSELWETIYYDKVRLIAVDHPDSVDVYVDETFSPPPFPEYRVYPVAKKYIPVTATDNKGNDLLPYIVEKDDKYVSNFKLDKYQGITEMKDLILDLGKAGSSAKNLYLFLNGWVFPTDASINYALSQSDAIHVASPVIQVINKKGEWETVIDNLGFPMGKNKTMVVNLNGKFLTDDMHIRIRTNMQIYWDQIFYTTCDFSIRVNSYELSPVSADLHYRGFSAGYRKGGQYGPHWFDYYDVSKEAKWRDLIGNYTRYGDVLPLLREADDKYIISNAGDEVSIGFNADGLPELKKGWTRDFMIYNVGWVKDGDLNTACGKTVNPLPFHGMTHYPYGKDETYPTDSEHMEYQDKYNTRKVTAQEYLNALKK